MAKLYIREDICKGCGLCIEVCPKKNAKGYHPITVTDESACIGCASCARMCPDCVFTVEK